MNGVVLALAIVIVLVVIYWVFWGEARWGGTRRGEWPEGDGATDRYSSGGPPPPRLARISAEKARLRLSRLWVDHVIWMRQCAVSIAGGLRDIEYVKKRLRRNGEEIADMFCAVYGKSFAAELEALLADHWAIGMQVVEAKDQKAAGRVASLDRAWRENAGQIATALARVNPWWRREDVLAMLQDHLTLMEKGMDLRIEEDWDAEGENFEAAMSQAHHMADVLATGLVMQQGQ